MLHAGAGVALSAGRTRAEAFGIVRRATSVSERSAAGALRAEETYVGASVRWAHELGDFRAGVFLGAGLRLLRVEGETRLGVGGVLERAVPSVAFGPEARLELLPWLDARFAVGQELMLRRQRFSVNGNTLLDLGAERTSAELELMAAFW
jgi:hypothetical protein